METSEAEGADGVTVQAEAVPTGTRVVLLETGYGATGTALLWGTTGAAGAVLRMTAGVEEVATMTGVEVAASTGLVVDEIDWGRGNDWSGNWGDRGRGDGDWVGAGCNDWVRQSTRAVGDCQSCGLQGELVRQCPQIDQ